MLIYLVRHAEAVPEEDAGSDRDRWLSPRGREAARILGRLLREQQIDPAAIVCSPLPRAVQTAELIADSTGVASDDDGAGASLEGAGASLETTAELGSTGVTGVGVPRLKIQMRPMMTITATMMMIQALRFMMLDLVGGDETGKLT